jgi:thiamine-monophosphate kinase
MPLESEIIDRLRKRARTDPRVRIGIGDDAAVIETEGPTDLIVCCDLLVEGVHFRPEWTPPFLLGRKSLAVSLSDVAAMGGIPRFATTSIAIPAWCTSEFVDQFFDGLFELAEASGVSIIGGDTSSSRDSLFIDVSLIGECARGKAVGRRGARSGDRIFVSGSLGGSALGLLVFQNGFRLSDADSLDPLRNPALKHLSPEPRLALGRDIGKLSLATSMIDISDGLSTDLWHILDESKVGARIRAAAIPVGKSTVSIAVERGVDAIALALNSGEEYELLFTVNPSNVERVKQLAESLGEQITEIGFVVESGGLQLERDNTVVAIEPRGYQHVI